MIEELARIRDLVLDTVVKQEQATHVNPLNRRAAKCFSQTDEDISTCTNLVIVPVWKW